MLKNIEIVSLSRGIIGEPFVAHELELGKKRLHDAVIWNSTSTGLIPPYHTSTQDYFRAFVGGSNVLTLSLGSAYTSTVQFRCVFYYTKTTD